MWAKFIITMANDWKQVGKYFKKCHPKRTDCYLCIEPKSVTYLTAPVTSKKRQSPIANRQSPIANRQSPIANRQSIQPQPCTLFNRPLYPLIMADCTLFNGRLYPLQWPTVPSSMADCTLFNGRLYPLQWPTVPSLMGHCTLFNAPQFCP